MRGLTAQREGTSFEIGLLARLGKLARVLAVGDDSTDWAHVDALLRRHGGDPAGLQRLRADAPGKGNASEAADALFSQLLRACTQPVAAMPALVAAV